MQWAEKSKLSIPQFWVWFSSLVHNQRSKRPRRSHTVKWLSWFSSSRRPSSFLRMEAGVWSVKLKRNGKEGWMKMLDFFFQFFFLLSLGPSCCQLSIGPPPYYYLYPSVHRLRFCRVCACVWGSWENGTLLSGQMTASFTFRIYTFRRRNKGGGREKRDYYVRRRTDAGAGNILLQPPQGLQDCRLWGVSSIQKRLIFFLFLFLFPPSDDIKKSQEREKVILII